MSYFNKTSEGYLLRVRLAPTSSSCKISGTINNAENENFLKISVISVPEKGKANKELLEFLSKQLKISKNSMEIVGGELDRWKKIVIKTNNNLTDKLSELSEE